MTIHRTGSFSIMPPGVDIFMEDVNRANLQRLQLARCAYCGCAVTDPVHCDSCGAPVPYGGFVQTQLPTCFYSY